MGRALDPEELQRDDLLVEILRYVIAHPKAKDTVSGIEKWWLSQSISGEGRKRIEALLNSLVAKGWFISRRSPQAETIYSLNEDTLHEILEFLNKEQ